MSRKIKVKSTVRNFPQTNKISGILSFIVLSVMSLFSPRKQQILKFISIAKNLYFTCSPFPTAKFDILTHPPPLITSAPQAPRENEKRQRKIQTLASCPRTLVGVGAHDDPAVTPQCHRGTCPRENEIEHRKNLTIPAYRCNKSRPPSNTKNFPIP